MSCPAKGFSAAVNRSGFDVLSLAWPPALSTFKGAAFAFQAFQAPFAFQAMSPEFMRRHPPLDRSFATGPARNRGALMGLSLCGSPAGDACRRRELPLSHSSSHPMRNAALHWPRQAPTSGSRTPAGSSGLRHIAPKRVSHGQQNAYRCVSPRRNQGGRPSR
jgi:hypothetical protein